ncbi:zinc-dependent alcohol dehydrogenase family protein [Sorangium sp. So ce128]|uniref:zinc-dependent alcohol dehydrogenase family protein n=1 Tax=Sorangium sp. So ce128 TaxID=3133281 RepID=UPI003F64746E
MHGRHEMISSGITTPKRSDAGRALQRPRMRRWELDAPGVRNLTLRDARRPEPGPREVLVRIQAVSLNYRDLLMWEGRMGELAHPYVPGSDFAGQVVELGPLATRFFIGDRVVGVDIEDWIDGAAPGLHTNTIAVSGRLAEFAAVSEDMLVAAPQTLGPEEASTLSTAGLTAWMAVVETGRVRAGQTWVVQGTGGVSLFALQFAAAHGAKVILTSSSDEKLAFGLGLGARAGINYRTRPHWDREVMAFTSGRGADAVIEMAAGENLATSVEALAYGGRILLVGLLDSDRISTPVGPLLLRRATINAIGVGPRRALEDMIRAIDGLGIRPVVAATYDLVDLPAAVAHLQGGAVGKVVVRVQA